MDRKRVPGLDCGRAIAVVSVVAVHLSFQFPHLPHWAKIVARMGQYGVQLFFVISAVTIFMTLEAERARYASTGQIVLRFYVKRFFRIAPLYYVAIVGYGLMSWYTYTFQADHASILGPHDTSDILLNLFFVHALSDSAINNVVPGGWSIGVEMLFYLIAPLVFFCTGGSRSRLAALSVLLMSACAASLITGACGGRLECSVQNNTFFYFWPPVQVPCFLVGFWCWNLFGPYLVGQVQLSRRGMAVALFVSILCGAGTAVLGVWLGLAHELAPIVAACGAAALLLACCSRADRSLTARIADAIGRESYGVYLWHFIFPFAAMYVFRDSTFLATHGSWMSLAVFMLTLAAAVAASYALSRVTDTLIQRGASELARTLLQQIDMRFGFGAAPSRRLE